MGYEIGDMQKARLLWTERISKIIRQAEEVSLDLQKRPHLLQLRLGFYKGLLGVGVMLKHDFKDPLEAFRRAFE